MLIYGAHLLRNGAALILDRLMAQGWLTHLATNGAGTIHDWEFAWLGRSTESVRDERGHRHLRHLGRDRPQSSTWPCWPAALRGRRLRPRRWAASSPRTA